MNWLPFTVVALAAWRTFHLLALDDITEPLRKRLTQHRQALEEWIECPYCLGFWVALAWVGYVAIDETWAFWTALPFGISTIIIAVHHVLAD